MTLTGKTALVTGGRGGIRRAIVARFLRESDVSVTGTSLTCKYASPLLRSAAREGVTASVATVGSYDGFLADPGLAAWCATNGAVHAPEGSSGSLTVGSPRTRSR